MSLHPIQPNNSDNTESVRESWYLEPDPFDPNQEEDPELEAELAKCIIPTDHDFIETTKTCRFCGTTEEQAAIDTRLLEEGIES
jgi:hypothetical protein